jgi:hypothetical protein
VIRDRESQSLERLARTTLDARRTTIGTRNRQTWLRYRLVHSFPRRPFSNRRSRDDRPGLSNLAGRLVDGRPPWQLTAGRSVTFDNLIEQLPILPS